MKRFFFFLLSCLLSFSCHSHPLIFDHDGGTDDYLALMLLLAKPSTPLKAVLVSPADSWRAPAIDITRVLLQRLHAKPVRLAAGVDQGTHPFPANWRNSTYRLLVGQSLFPETDLSQDTFFTSTSAPELLAEKLSQESFDIVETGPLSNVADMLSTYPKLAKRIHRIYFMGGAFKVSGNVHVGKRVRSAEWNVYNNPLAVKTVLDAHIPLVFVALDATNRAPISHDYVASLKAQRRYPASNMASHFIAAEFEEISHFGSNQLFFWDVMTAMAYLHPELFHSHPAHVEVLTSGPDEGRTLEFPGKPFNAVIIDDVDSKAFEKALLAAYRY